jgi:hypothetical protein
MEVMTVVVMEMMVLDVMMSGLMSVVHPIVLRLGQWGECQDECRNGNELFHFQSFEWLGFTINRYSLTLLVRPSLPQVAPEDMDLKR